jgi:phosphoribosylanthranilate isomerase
MPTWIKICGTTSVADALDSVEAGADALGFIFAPSPRRITPEAAQEIAARLPANIERIGVFVNESPARIRAITTQVGLTAVQLHGSESPEFISSLFEDKTRGGRVGIIKAILVDNDFESQLARFQRRQPVADSILLDSGAGSGRAFNWQKALSRSRQPGTRFIVAGGLTPENVGEAVRTLAPWGVDVVSGVEREPGKKDPQKLKDFVAAVRKAEQK